MDSKFKLKCLLDLTLTQQLISNFGKMLLRNLSLLTLLLLVFFVFKGNAQTTTIDFEIANSGYTPSTTFGSGWTDVFNRSNSTSISASNQTGYYWAVEDLGPNNPTIILDQINISGSSDFTFSIDMLAHHYNDWDATDELKIVYSIDGGAYQNLMWVQMVPGDAFNAPAALDLAFDGNGDCGASTTLPSISTGTQHGCSVSSSDFATFTTAAIPLSGNTTLDIRLEFYGLTSGDEGIYIDNIIITETAGASCAISDIGLTNVQCNDNGTSGTTADDYITFDLNPTGSNLGTNYTVSVSSSSITSATTAAYGGTSSFTLASGSAGSGNITVTVTDNTDGSCTANDLLTDPGTCSVAPCTEPSQGTNLTFSNVTDTQIDGSYTASGADEYLVVYSTSSSLSGNPVDATSYSAGDPLGGGTVVQSSSSTTFSQTGLSPSTQYYFFVFAYNNTACSGGPNYNITAPLSDDETTLAGPTCFTTQSFEGSGSWSYTENPSSYNSSGDVWAIVTTLGGNTPSDGSNFWGIQDIDNGIATGEHVLEFTSVNTSSYTSLTIDFDWFAEGFDGGDYMAYEVNYDGGGWSRTTICNACNTQTSGIISTTESISVHNGTNTVQLRLIANQNGGSDYGGFDNILLCGIAAATGPCAEPTAQATSLVFDQVTENTIGGDFTFSIDATEYLVIASTSSSLSGNPVDGVSYSAGDPLGGGTVVQSSSDTFFLASSLSASTTYYFFIIAYNHTGCTGGPDYYTTSPLTDNETTAIPSSTCGEEDFANIPSGSSTSYLTRNWTGLNGVDWTATDARTDQTINGDAILLRNGSLTNDNPISGGIGVLTVSTQLKFTGSSGTLNVYVNGVLRGTVPYGGSVQTSSLTINVSGNVDLEIENNSGDRVAIDDLEWECYSGCTSSHTISGFFPSSGPVGTRVTITGTNFTGSTTVELGGQAASVISQTDSTLIVEVPASASTGSIVVSESGCDLNSSGDFTVLDGTGSCISAGGAGFNDLFISEVYDAGSGNGFYLELFNPTGSAIDLASADYEIDRYGDISSASPSNNIDLTGTVAAYSTFTMRLHSTNPCSSTSFDFTSASNFGINENDKIILTKSGTDVDVVHAPNETGYTIIRQTSATAPSSTYNGADWSTASSESCTDLGSAPVMAVSPPSISVHPTDVNSCDLNFSITAAAGSGGTLTYQWYFNDSLSSGWLEVNNSNLSGYTISGETTDDLSISSNSNSVGDISGYQFYCEVLEDGTCGAISNAAQYNADGERYFRSKTTGDWDALNSWEISTSAAGPTWIDACQLPSSANSDSVIIQSGHNITVNVDSEIDQLFVSAGGTLTLTEKLTIEDGNPSGTDLMIAGTLQDNGSTANGLDFSSNATWEMASSGVVIKTNSSSVAKYRDNYEGGISTIPSDADWVYLYTGSNVSVIAVNMFYPNLHFESNAGTFTANGFSTAFSGGSGGYLTVKGDMNIGLGIISGGTDGYEVYNSSINATPMQILGDLTIATNSSLTNESYNGGSSTSHGNGTGFAIEGNVDVDGVLEVAHGTGELIFSGSSRQTLSGSGSIDAYEVSINNGADIALSGIDLETQILSFTDGKIITNTATSDQVWVKSTATNAISGATSTNGTDEYVEGKLQWTTDGSSTYTFPIGDATYGAQGFTINLTGSNNSTILGYTEARTAATTPTISYAWCDLEIKNPASATNAGQGTAGYDGILDLIQFDYPHHTSPIQWDITNPSGGISNYDVTVLATGNPAVNTVATSANAVEVRYLMKNGEPGENVPDTTAHTTPTYAGPGFYSCPNGFTLSGMTTFSKFLVVGAIQSNTILPIELSYFRGKNWGQSNVLEWETETELNNDYFTLERMNAFGEFESIAEINGAGNSYSPLHYQFTDFNLEDDVHYYRLKQTDFDGKFSYSDHIQLGNTSSNNLNSFYWDTPNKQLIFEASEQTRVFRLLDLSGRLVKQYLIEPNAKHYMTLPFAHGLYIAECNGERKKIWIDRRP